jgi:hypothetical protein
MFYPLILTCYCHGFSKYRDYFRDNATGFSTHVFATTCLGIQTVTAAALQIRLSLNTEHLNCNCHFESSDVIR